MSSLIISKRCILLSDRPIRNAIIHRTSLTDVDFCWQRCNATHPRSFPSFSFTRDLSPQRGTGVYQRWRILCAKTNREILLFLRRKFEYNVAIEREFRAPFDELERSCIPVEDFTLWPGSPIPRLSIRFSSLENYLETFSWLETVRRHAWRVFPQTSITVVYPSSILMRR